MHLFCARQWSLRGRSQVTTISLCAIGVQKFYIRNKDTQVRIVGRAGKGHTVLQGGLTSRKRVSIILFFSYS